jgi:hypothetical protein
MGGGGRGRTHEEGACALNRQAQCAGGLASRRSLPRHLHRRYGGEAWHARVTGGRRRIEGENSGEVRAASVGAPRGREARPEGCGARTRGRGPASASGYGDVQRARRGALERGGAFQPCGLFRVAMFNRDFLPILQLKCTEE